MNYCRSCKHFVQYYMFAEQSLQAVDCGHCAQSPHFTAIIKRTLSPACPYYYLKTLESAAQKG